MRKKLRDQRGLTLVELLCAAAILILLGLMLNAGLQMALRSYRDVVAQSEVDLLLGTLSDALADDLRYARDVSAAEDGTLLHYSSDSYNTGGRTSLELSETGQVMAGGKRVLPAGAYGNGAYRVWDLSITYDSAGEESFFRIKLKVGQTEGEISAGTELTVRCLSGPGASGEESGG